VLTPLSGVTIVTQTRTAEGAEGEFARFQNDISIAIANQPGFIEQSVLPPSPPVQVDWVILQRFVTAEFAIDWLHSEARAKLLASARPFLVGPDDVHLLREGQVGALPAPVSLVITTKVQPGREDDFQRWELRITAEQAQAPGFLGYRLEPPIPGVQEDFMAILRFETNEMLQGWMNSPKRAALLAEAKPFVAEVRTRVVQAGFTQWFTAKGEGPPAWKQNMVVLLMLYPVVFLFGLLVQTPLLMNAWGLPFWFALFVGNLAGVVLLNWLVPWASRRFAWWLKPQGSALRWTNWAGIATVVGLYCVLMASFSRF
jgi:antibiotic biosynthesis monooxygenase (ABM) superfamily enzyme